jgi:uncharacterized small protein (DUF1192 family)
MIDPFLDDRRLKPKAEHELGQDLAPISIDELEARIAALNVEIGRIEAEIARKRAVKSAAVDFFKPR